MNKAILIDVIDPKTSKEEAQKRLEEIESLVKTYGGIVIEKVIQKRSLPDYETYIGKGKVTELKEHAEAMGANLIIVNNILKPRQIFTLQEKFDEKSEKIVVWDRVDLILKIFSKHATSTEAKLQIELASIRHMGPRIFGLGKDLMQQTGGIGQRSGQGETNIELMKRHLKKQEIAIQKKLDHYDTIGEGHRKSRQRKNLKTVALVGYTNAGKSALLNALTNKGAYVANKLFATLQTRIGTLYISPENHHENGKYVHGKEVLISDTIGFIRDLPPSLIQAFTSTLKETIEANLILHVIDITDRDIDKKIKVVEEILDQLGLHDKPKIYVFNKIDLIDHQAKIPKKHWHAHGHAAAQKTAEEHHYESLTFNPDQPIPGMLKAGRYTSHLLGWRTKEQQAKKLALYKGTSHVKPARLLKKYGEFNPIFIAAEEKLNLQKLIEEIRKIA
ncbi:GTPase HflX [Candidatus Peregrinibacteria bacterium]|nr:GTPase HflX [Candidatus Peregrinibacteria bacterium]